MLHQVQRQNDRLADMGSLGLRDMERQIAQIAEVQAALLREIVEQNTHIAGTQTALLQSAIYLIENFTATLEDVGSQRVAGARIQDIAALKEQIERLSEQLRERPPTDPGT